MRPLGVVGVFVAGFIFVLLVDLCAVPVAVDAVVEGLGELGNPRILSLQSGDMIVIDHAHSKKNYPSCQLKSSE